MSLVSNFISGITSSGMAGGNAVNSNFDLDDTTFSDLLNKQMNIKTDENINGINMLGSLGMPAGMQIEGVDFSEKVQDQMEAFGEKLDTEKIDTQNTNIFDLNKDGNTTASEAGRFVASLFENSEQGNNSRSELYNFARRQATNFYGKYSGNVVTNINEFVDDIKELIS